MSGEINNTRLVNETQEIKIKEKEEKRASEQQEESIFTAVQNELSSMYGIDLEADISQEKLLSLYKTVMAEETNTSDYSIEQDYAIPEASSGKNKTTEQTTTDTTTSATENNKYVTKVSAQKDGLFQIKLYSDGNTKKPKYTDTCIKVQGKNGEQKYIFGTGQQNSVTFKDNGKDISVEVSQGNRLKSYTVQKNDDGTYSIGKHVYNSIDEMAVILNHTQVKSSIEADGVVSASQQGFHMKDCSLLSALNSLSYTPEGREIIKNAFVYNEDKNTVTVNLPGFNISVDVKLRGSGGGINNSMGDIEPYALEEALKVALKKVKNGEIKLSDDAPYWCKRPQDIEYIEVNALHPQQIFYALTGMECNKRNDTTKEMKTWLNSFEQNQNMALVASTYKEGTSTSRSQSGLIGTKDAFGNPITISRQHAYAVKDVTTKTDGKRVITIVDPTDSSRQIVMKEDDFLKVFEAMDTIKLTNNNKHPQYYH